MKYRRFGKTNLSMPVFSCGGMRYQFKWQDVPVQDIPAENQDNLETTIRRAVELGIVAPHILKLIQLSFKKLLHAYKTMLK